MMIWLVYVKVFNYKLMLKQTLLSYIKEKDLKDLNDFAYMILPVRIKS